MKHTTPRCEKEAGLMPKGNHLTEAAPGGAPSIPAVAQSLDPLAYGTDDLATVLRTSVATIHRLRAAGKLPRAHRFGAQLRWDVGEVRRWVRAGMPDLKTWEAMDTER